jgi:hypothetical protein
MDTIQILGSIANGLFYMGMAIALGLFLYMTIADIRSITNQNGSKIVNNFNKKV